MILKECPFCGSKDIEDCYVYMMCNKCGVEGPKMNGGNNDSHADYIDRENAMKAWNKRVPVIVCPEYHDVEEFYKDDQP